MRARRLLRLCPRHVLMLHVAVTGSLCWSPAHRPCVEASLMQQCLCLWR